MKKKIFTLALAVVIAIIAITGATLAYLTDTDAEDNVFTMGNVKIDLRENFDESLALLMPSTGTDQEGNVINSVEKQVFVYNEGKNDAFVRVHIAIPAILDDGTDTLDAGADVLHVVYDEDSVADGKWSWSSSADSTELNTYTTTIDGVLYNVYVVTYSSVLASDTNTANAIDCVYLDSKVTSADVEAITEVLGDSWSIYVAAEGVQAKGFADAYTALDTAFGAPGTYSVWSE